jgi:hypothetical protein
MCCARVERSESVCLTMPRMSSKSDGRSFGKGFAELGWKPGDRDYRKPNPVDVTLKSLAPAALPRAA